MVGHYYCKEPLTGIETKKLHCYIVALLYSCTVAGGHACIITWLCRCIVAGLLAYTIASLLACAATLPQACTITCDLGYTAVLHLRHLATSALAHVLDWWLIGGGSWLQSPGLRAAGSGMMPLARMCGRTQRMGGTAAGTASQWIGRRASSRKKNSLFP